MGTFFSKQNFGFGLPYGLKWA